MIKYYDNVYETINKTICFGQILNEVLNKLKKKKKKKKKKTEIFVHRVFLRMMFSHALHFTTRYLILLNYTCFGKQQDIQKAK